MRGSYELVANQLRQRHEHFMNPELLQSQFATLEEPEPAEGAIAIEPEPTPRELVDEIKKKLKLNPIGESSRPLLDVNSTQPKAAKILPSPAERPIHLSKNSDYARYLCERDRRARHLSPAPGMKPFRIPHSAFATAGRIFERQAQRDRLDCIMTKFIALVAAGLFAAGTMFAGEHGDCTKQAGNKGKMACQVSLASLDLTADQKTKMDAVMAEHQKAGCSKESEKTYMKEAKGILTAEQYAKFKAECKGEKDKTNA